MSYIGSWGSLDREWAEGCFQFAPAIDVVKPAISTRIPGGTTATVLRLKVIKAGLLSRKGMSSSGQSSGNAHLGPFLR